MAKSLTMVMSNKVSRGNSLHKLSGIKKNRKKNSTITILLTLSKFRGEFRTQSKIKNKTISKNKQQILEVNYFCKRLHLRYYDWF